MKKHTLFILILSIVAFFCILFTFKLFSYGPANSIGELTKSKNTVKINNFSIPAYDFNQETYVIVENLEQFGISYELDKKNKILNIRHKTDYFVEQFDVASLKFVEDGVKVVPSKYQIYIEGNKVQSYSAGKYSIISVNELNFYCKLDFDEQQSLYSGTLGVFELTKDNNDEKKSNTYEKKVIVLDPGHGKPSTKMSDEEKQASGWIKNSNGNWGEWRHFKSGETSPDCEGSGCSKKSPANGGCWYPIENSDRDTEPQINLNNCLSAKKYLEEMGYEVRLTRTSNDENPSITKRLTYCYPDNNTEFAPDALLYVCIHSNAGDGAGSSYIELSGNYDHPQIPGDYVKASNTLGKYINERIGKNTLLKTNAPIKGLESLIVFRKASVVCSYMEIGFYDNKTDLAILNESTDTIGKSIAEGIDNFLNEYY